MKICVIVESINADFGSGPKANLAMIKNLIQVGFSVQIFHYSRREIKVKGAESTAIEENRSNIIFFLSRLERYLRYLFKIKLNPFIEKKIGFSFTLFNDRNSIIAFLKKQDVKDFDWVLTLSQGGSFRPHHALLKIPEWHSKWIAYIHDPYPMHWYPKPYTWKEPGYKLKQEFMEKIAEKSRFTAFPSLHLKEWMGSHFKPYKEKGLIIPHQLMEGLPMREPNFIDLNPNEFNVIHAGNFLQARKPYGLIEGFKKFLKECPDANTRLIHIGPAPHYEGFLSTQAENNPKILVFCENKHFEEVIWLQNKAAVNVIIEAKAEFSPFLPGKFPHCIAAGKPILILGPPRSETRRLLGENYPFVAMVDDSERVAMHLKMLYEDWKCNRTTVNYDAIKHYLSSKNLNKIFSGL